MANPVFQQRPETDAEADPPLDPAVERIRRKLARLMVGSIGVMVLGLIAVFAAIVYKVTDKDARSAMSLDPAVIPTGDEVPAKGLVLPAGVKILESDLDGDRVLLRLAVEDGSEQIIVYDLATGNIVAHHKLEGSSPP